MIPTFPLTAPTSRLDANGPEASSIIQTPTGWSVAASGDMRAHLRDWSDAIIGRIAPGRDPQVVQLGIGDTTSLLCDAVFSPARDIALAFRADSLTLTPQRDEQGQRRVEVQWNGPLTITLLRDFMKLHRDLPWFTPLDRERRSRPPAGWCSWYGYDASITEADILRETAWLARELAPFGCEYVQIDSGWEGDRTGASRDWFHADETAFPHGMKWLAQAIREQGMKPGIWCIPQGQSSDDLFKRTPEAFLRDAAGDSVNQTPATADELADQADKPRRAIRMINGRNHFLHADEATWIDWTGRYCLDVTNPAGMRQLRDVFRLFCDDWDYDYVKIDGSTDWVNQYEVHRQRLADPSRDPILVIREALNEMRTILGPDRFLLNCFLGWHSCGLCDGVRVGYDVGGAWGGFLTAVNASLKRLYLNGIAFHTDPDCVLQGPGLTDEQARAWAVFVGITGQMLMTSDRMAELPADRVDSLRRVLPVADIHPMELYPLDTVEKPGIFNLKVNLPDVGAWDVAAAFNWSIEADRTVRLSPRRLGLPDGAWLCLDAWTGERLPLDQGEVVLTAPPGGCRVASFWPDHGRPSFLGTDRHLTQGAVDVIETHWDPDRLRLSGVARVVAGWPTRVRFHVPAGIRCVTEPIELADEVGAITLLAEQSGDMAWRVDFESC